jgi:hypothetical protein
LALAQAKNLIRVAFGITSFLLIALCDFDHQSSVAALLAPVLNCFQTTDEKQEKLA